MLVMGQSLISIAEIHRRTSHWTDFGLGGAKTAHESGKGLPRIVGITLMLIAIGIIIYGFYLWITRVRQSEGVLQSIELSLEPPAACIEIDHYGIYVQQSAPIKTVGTFSNGSRLDVSMDPDLTYHLSPCEELVLDEINNRVTGLLVSDEAISLYVKIKDVVSNTIYIEVDLPTQ